AGVGAANAPANQVLVVSPNRSSTDPSIVPSCNPPPTKTAARCGRPGPRGVGAVSGPFRFAAGPHGLATDPGPVPGRDGDRSGISAASGGVPADARPVRSLRPARRAPPAVRPARPSHAPRPAAGRPVTGGGAPDVAPSARETPGTWPGAG